MYEVPPRLLRHRNRSFCCALGVVPQDGCRSEGVAYLVGLVVDRRLGHHTRAAPLAARRLAFALVVARRILASPIQAERGGGESRGGETCYQVFASDYGRASSRTEEDDG